MNDMIPDTTVEKRGAYTVHLKTTGHEKSKMTVWLLYQMVPKRSHFVCSKEENVR